VLVPGNVLYLGAIEYLTSGQCLMQLGWLTAISKTNLIVRLKEDSRYCLRERSLSSLLNHYGRAWFRVDRRVGIEKVPRRNGMGDEG
jgi:hypothetical protein